MLLSLVTILLVSLAILARGLQRAWTAPGAFFALVWVVAACPATIFFPEAVTPLAMLVVCSFVVAVLLGSEIAMYAPEAVKRRAAPPASAGAGLHLQPVHLTWLSALLGTCGLAACVSYVWDADHSLSDLGDAAVWLDMALHYSVARYREEYLEPIIVRFLISATYASALVSGVLIAIADSLVRRLAATVAIVAGAFITVITTAKAPLLVTCSFTFAGWLSARVARASWLARRGGVRRWLVLAAIVSGIAVVSVGSLVLRYGEGGQDSELIVQRVAGYLFGQMAALSAWLRTENWNLLRPTWGALSFVGLAEFLRGTTRAPGVYTPIEVNYLAGETNVFTALRGAITDFGIFGAWLVASLLGALGGLCYRHLRCSQSRTARGMLGLIVFYAFAVWSPIISIFGYNVTLLAMVIAAIAIRATWSEIEACMMRESR